MVDVLSLCLRDDEDIWLSSPLDLLANAGAVTWPTRPLERDSCGVLDVRNAGHQN
jgi:hypothetical protein